MAHSVLIIGESGSGKSTGIRNLNPAETVIINVANKPLPFRGWKSAYVRGENMYTLKEFTNAQGIVDEYVLGGIFRSVNENESIKTLIIDDFQYIFAQEYFAKADEKGYEKFTKLAKLMNKLSTYPIKMRDDLTVFFLTHSEEAYDSDGNRRVKAKTIGKMIDNVLTLEGLFSIVLFAKAKKTKEGISYLFETQTNGENTCKSPMGMFESKEIDNDLEFVRTSIINYEN